MNSEGPTKHELFVFFVLAGVVVPFLLFIIHGVGSTSTDFNDRDNSLTRKESDWPQTHTSAGRMITVTHDGHQYVITTHGHGVHVIHNPNCPCLLKAEK